MSCLLHDIAALIAAHDAALRTTLLILCAALAIPLTPWLMDPRERS
jgi:hypothetical protein